MNAVRYEFDPSRPNSFSLSFERCAYEPKTWKEEMYAAALRITNESAEPLWLCLSGGIDSEIMCQAFFDQGINFGVLTLEHEHGTNEHDISFARAWCKAHGVVQKIIRIDMDEFLEREIERYIGDGYVALHPFRYQQLKLLETAESLGGRAVLGGGEHLYELKDSSPLTSEDIYHRYRSDFLLPLEWNKRHGTAHQPYFYLQTSELILSYLNSPFVSCALAQPETFRHPMSKFTLKRLAFQAAWPKNAARFKYDGFEKIADKIQKKKQDLRQRFDDPIQTFDLPIMKLKRDISCL